MKNLTAFVLVMLFSVVSLAEREIVVRFRQAAIRAVEIAEAKGMTEVQGIRLTDIKTAAKKALIIHYPNVKLRFSNRMCALWQPGPTVKPHIYLNADCEELNDADLQSLALHEVLGLAFGLDRDYEISTEIVFAGSPFASGIKNPKLIDYQALAQTQNKIRLDRENVLSGGGAVGVGGGGDPADMRFKMQGLKELQKYTKQGHVYGVPLELLDLAIRKMRIAPARDIELLLEFRGVGVEQFGAIAYIQSSSYRNPNANNGFLAINAARMFILHAPEQLGLTETNNLIPNYYVSKILKQPYLLIPGTSGSPHVTWRNTDLINKMSKKEADAALGKEMARYDKMTVDPQLQYCISQDDGFMVIRLRDRN